MFDVRLSTNRKSVRYSFALNMMLCQKSSVLRYVSFEDAHFVLVGLKFVLQIGFTLFGLFGNWKKGSILVDWDLIGSVVFCLHLLHVGWIAQ